MPGFVGPWEIVILVVIVVALFGVKRLPDVGRSLGKGVREVRDAVSMDEAKETVQAFKPPKPSVRSLLLGEKPSDAKDED